MTGFPALLCGRSKTKTQVRIARERHQLFLQGPDLAQQFSEEIDPALLQKFSNTTRVRHYPDHLVFWAFLSQVLGNDGSCADAVSRVQSWASVQNLPVPSSHTASYCQARMNLPIKMLEAVNLSLCNQLEANLSTSSKWRGLTPKAEDGTTADHRIGIEPGCTGCPRGTCGNLLCLLPL